MSDILNALSVLLAAYGLFLTAVISNLQGVHADSATISVMIRSEAEKELSARQNSTWTALTLAVAPTIVTVLFGSVFLTILSQINIHNPYSPIKAATALIIAFWALLAIVMWVQFLKLIRHKRLLIERLQPEKA